MWFKTILKANAAVALSCVTTCFAIGTFIGVKKNLGKHKSAENVETESGCVEG